MRHYVFEVRIAKPSELAWDRATRSFYVCLGGHVAMVLVTVKEENSWISDFFKTLILKINECSSRNAGDTLDKPLTLTPWNP